MAVDETVQVFGGYGFVEEYPAERAYRDSRVNRIFEGTNEINRMIITGFLMKRAMSGQLALLPAIKKVMEEVLAGPSTDEIEGPLAAERTIVSNAKKIGLLGSRRGLAEIYAGSCQSAGNHGCDCRHHHRGLCDGVGGSAYREAGHSRRVRRKQLWRLP